MALRLHGELVIRHWRREPVDNSDSAFRPVDNVDGERRGPG
jgi:hypothetical protein